MSRSLRHFSDDVKAGVVRRHLASTTISPRAATLATENQKTISELCPEGNRSAAKGAKTMENSKAMSDTPTLSSRAQQWLEKYSRGDNADTLERIEAKFVAASLPVHPKVICALLQFGGYCIPMGPDGRFKFHRAKAAVRMYRFYGVLSDNPDRFRIQFGESETSQTLFTMDGHGRLFEDGQPIANSVVDWIEARVKQGNS